MMQCDWYQINDMLEGKLIVEVNTCLPSPSSLTDEYVYPVPSLAKLYLYRLDLQNFKTQLSGPGPGNKSK